MNTNTIVGIILITVSIILFLFYLILGKFATQRITEELKEEY